MTMLLIIVNHDQDHHHDHLCDGFFSHLYSLSFYIYIYIHIRLKKDDNYCQHQDHLRGGVFLQGRHGGEFAREATSFNKCLCTNLHLCHLCHYCDICNHWLGDLRPSTMSSPSACRANKVGDLQLSVYTGFNAFAENLVLVSSGPLNV